MTTTNELILPPTVAGQIAFHTRMAAAAAIVRPNGEADTEAMLTWTMLLDAGAVAPELDLPGPRVLKISEARLENALRRTQALALELQAHFVSEGQIELAELYARTAAGVGDAADQLRSI